MHPVHHQREANKVMEGGVFYPTGHIVAAFKDEASASKAQERLVREHWPEDHVVYVDPSSMEAFATAPPSVPNPFWTTSPDSVRSPPTMLK